MVAYTSVDQVFSQPIFNQCAEATGLDVRVVYDTEETKSTGVLNRLLAEAENPQADLFWSGDPVRPFVLVAKGLVEPYVSPSAADIPEEFKAADGTWTGLAARARVFLVNDSLLPPGQRPSSVRDLADPRFRGRAAMANPLFGTTTMHVAALAEAWGTEELERFLGQVRENQVRMASSNGEVKRLVAEGEAAFGLLDTDDALDALADGGALSVVYPDQDGMGTLVMPTSVVLLRGSPHPAEGRRLADCLLDRRSERRMVESAGHLPLRAGLPVPDGARGVSEMHVMEVDYARVARTMEEMQPWLREWVGL